MRLFAPAIALLLVVGAAGPASAQESAPPPTLRLFLDCGRGCDRTFIRSEISLVDFVNERTAADVHLLITTQETGSGGRAYSLVFIGQRTFSALQDTLSHTSRGTATSDERRRGLTRMIKSGLVRYLVRTALEPSVDIALVREESDDEDAAESTVADPWDYWVFSVGGDVDYEAEESSDEYQLRGNISANRTTEEWKLRVSANGRYRERHFDLEEGRLTSSTRSGSVYGQAIMSLTPHWSAGGTVYVNTSSVDNTDVSVTAGPAIEYNIFPYSESTRREFRFQYGIRLDRRRYEEVTIFGLTEESLLRHSISAELDVEQAWGDMGFDAEFSHLLTNFDRSLTESYRLELDGNVDVRIARGLSVEFGAGYELIRDQLFLPLSDVSEEEVLLGTRRLPTGFDVSFRVGLNYRFGSIYNNVVNPRFGN